RIRRWLHARRDRRLMERRPGPHLAGEAQHIADIPGNVPPQPGATTVQSLENMTWRVELGLGPLIAVHQFVGSHPRWPVDDVSLGVVMPPIAVDNTSLALQLGPGRR